MRALVFDGTLSLSEIPAPVPAAGEALIRVEYSAICNTDIELTRGYLGFRGVPGHEFVGVVEQGSAALRGKRVVGEINCPCGNCALCRRALPTHCSQRTVLGIAGRPGVFAEYVALPEANLHCVPDYLASVRALFTEPLAAALQIFEQFHIRPTDRIILLGTGKLGLLTALVLQQGGYHYTAYNRNPRKIKLAQTLGINCRPLAELPPDERVDVCIDCTGNPQGMALALQHVRPRGTIVLKTTVADPAAFDINQIVINELTLIGSRCGPFAPALAMLAADRINPEPLVSAEFTFTNIVAAFTAAQKSDTVKVIINHA
ncbi:MAG TPA: alcohol dehydrogenase catalytic domain-containing protein [bacterium]|nr:alcohol dehydrogenase catalytic domain-containing protein [bacterium]